MLKFNFFFIDWYVCKEIVEKNIEGNFIMIEYFGYLFRIKMFFMNLVVIDLKWVEFYIKNMCLFNM